jgi:hypothetical protein
MTPAPIVVRAPPDPRAGARRSTLHAIMPPGGTRLAPSTQPCVLQGLSGGLLGKFVGGQLAEFVVDEG